MSRRDSDDRGNECVDGAMAGTHLTVAEARYFRLRCLEVAVRTFDPDGPIEPLALMDTALTLLRFVVDASIPSPPSPAP